MSVDKHLDHLYRSNTEDMSVSLSVDWDVKELRRVERMYMRRRVIEKMSPKG
jgi:hypothetical protein